MLSELPGQDDVSCATGHARQDRGPAPLPEGLSRCSYERGVGHLWDYVKSRGHACPPCAFRSSDGFKLGQWVGWRRTLRGQNHRLDAVLESLPGWSWSPKGEAFRRRLREFEDAVADHRLVFEPRLRRWAKSQALAAAAGKLSAERLAQLLSAGVTDLHMHGDEPESVCIQRPKG